AFALKQLLKKINPKTKIIIGAPEGTNKISEKIMNRFRLTVESNPTLDDIDVIFTVDTNNLKQLGKISNAIENFEKSIIIIDHHYPHPSMEKLSKIEFCDKYSPSTCEIIYELYNHYEIKPTKKVATILIIGILCETRHLRLATSKTILTISNLIKQGIAIEKLRAILEIKMDQSERLARLRAAQRIKISSIDGWIIVSTNVGSHHASAARALAFLGADLAIVGSSDKDRLKISLRSKEEFYQKSGIHLGRDLAKPLGDYVNGTGGGHSLAAGITGSGEVENALNKALEMLNATISKNKK
ncbi:MAG: DHH family phosphoesterase, partial [Candidatus Bathyarchaeota archaeon]|nr:DHH family phosphoesterase [Candidatus Bathyarchaeota archaeon]